MGACVPLVICLGLCKAKLVNLYLLIRFPGWNITHIFLWVMWLLPYLSPCDGIDRLGSRSGVEEIFIPQLRRKSVTRESKPFQWTRLWAYFTTIPFGYTNDSILWKLEFPGVKHVKLWGPSKAEAHQNVLHSCMCSSSNNSSKLFLTYSY